MSLGAAVVMVVAGASGVRAQQDPAQASPDAERAGMTPEEIRAELEAARARVERLERALERSEGESSARRPGRLGERLRGARREGLERPFAALDGVEEDDPVRRLGQESLFETLRETEPELFERLRALRAERPEEARRQMQRLAPRLMELARLRANDPEAFRMRLMEMRSQREMFRLGREIAERMRAGEETAELRVQMRSLIEEQLEARLSYHAEQIERTERRLAEAREELASHRARRDALVVERMDQILGRIEAFVETGERRGESGVRAPR
jgi:hypothetical protein